MTKPISILMERDNEVAELCFQVLTVNGYIVERVLTREEVLTRLELETPELVIIDLGHPIDQAVHDIIFRIKNDERLAKTRSVLLADDEEIAEPFKQTADMILVKPITEKQLQNLMN